MKTVSLELSKQLKESGYPQDNTFFYYGYNPIDPNREMALLPMLGITPNALEWYVSPTADEILDLLPEELIGDEGMRFDLNIYLGKSRTWVVCYWWDEDSRRSSDMYIKNTVNTSLANAAAKMWLYLKKQGLL